MAARSPALEGPPARLERQPWLATAARRMLARQLVMAAALASSGKATRLMQPRSSTRSTPATP
jgi:hypothetical protein